MRSASFAAETFGEAGAVLFLEVPLEGDAAVLANLLHAIAEANSAHQGLRCALKFRCGGLMASDVPSADALAAAVVACHRAGVPFKATAGLHHPLRHFDAALGVHRHGFLNLFGGAALTVAHDLDAAALRTILLDTDATHVRLTPDGLTWGDLCAPLEAVQASRRALACSFGSCSFAEPRDDLRRLGLLP